MSTPEPKGYGRLLGDALATTNSWLGGGVGVGLGILTGAFLPGHSVPLWVFAFVVFILVWILFSLLAALRVSADEAKNLYAQRGGAIVVAAVAPFSPYGTSKCVFIVQLTGSGSLPMGARVIISTAESNHERPLGTGLVRPAQQDGKSVVTLDEPNDDAAPLLEALLDPRHHDVAISKLRIGPAYDLQNLHPRRPPSLTSESLWRMTGDLWDPDAKLQPSDAGDPSEEE